MALKFRPTPSYPIYRTYALTVTMKDSPDLIKLSPKVQLQRTFRELNKILRRSCKFYLYPEFTPNNAIHYHGIIDIYDSIKWHEVTARTLHKKMGFCCIKTLKDEVWHKYSTKDLGVIEDLFPTIDFPLNYDSVITEAQVEEIADDIRLAFGYKPLQMTVLQPPVTYRSHKDQMIDEMNKQ